MPWQTNKQRRVKSKSWDTGWISYKERTFIIWKDRIKTFEHFGIWRLNYYDPWAAQHKLQQSDRLNELKRHHDPRVQVDGTNL